MSSWAQSRTSGFAVGVIVGAAASKASLFPFFGLPDLLFFSCFWLYLSSRVNAKLTIV
jgi:hypothetical protein